MDKGSIHIYCGEGKGKTTAAIGQGIQEASQGRSVIIIQFMKERNAEAIGFVQRLEPEIKLFRFQKAEEAFEDLPDAEKAEEIKNLKNALNFARKVLVTEECDVLILDEPTGNLDPKNSWEIMKLLERINEERGTTILVVTHNREIVNEMKKRVITMEKGVVISDEEKGGYIYED